MDEQLLGYEDEPPELFHPLPEKLGVQFYDLELSAFAADVPFYEQRLPREGLILDLGCGSGRLICALTRDSREICGGDLSFEMLAEARRKTPKGTQLICMDMRNPALGTTFPAILIGYNTLNLLTDQQTIINCLTACRKLLAPGGIILLQLYLQRDASQQATNKTFQFQIFDHPEGGQLIKEIRKTPNPADGLIAVNERFRVRLKGNNCILKEDYEQTFSVLAWPLTQWKKTFSLAQLHIDEIRFGYDNTGDEQAGSIGLLQLSADYC